jgi:hypothetical protein
MNKLKIFLFLFFFIPVTLLAQNSDQENEFRFRIGMGLTYPTGDWSEFFTIGLGVNAGIGYPIIQHPNLNFELLGSFGANIFFRESYQSESSWTRMVLAADGRLNIESVRPLTFFIQGGLGAYWDIVEIYDYPLHLYEKESDLGFGPRIGLGLAYKFV